MSFLSEKLCTEKVCYEASHNWFLGKDVDSTVVDNVSVGCVLQLQIFEKLFESSQVNADRNDIRSLLKKFNLEWTVRSFASLFDKESDKAQSDFLVVYDVNNDPMIQALNSIGSSLEEQGQSVSAVTIDSSISAKCSLARKISWFKCFSIHHVIQSIKKYILLKGASADSIEDGFGLLKDTFGLEKAKRVRRHYRTQALQVLLEIAAISSLLKKKNPKVVVLASDAHRVSRTFVFLCKSLKIKTVVYQHGATIWEYGYVPVYADRMLVWGRSAREWFEARGVASEKLVEVGNLRSDKEGCKPIAKNEFCEDRTVYFFPNPIGREITAKLVNLLVEICTRYGLNGVIKLHPSEKNIDFFMDAISKASCAIDISTAPMNEVGIKAGDVAIVVNSTAGIDCCLQGAYVFNVEVASMPNPIDYEGYGVGVKTNLTNYFDDFERLIAMSPEDYLLNRKVFVMSYLGNLDGKVRERARDFIFELAVS